MVRQTILVLSRQKPHTVLLLFASFVSGLLYVAGWGRSPSLDATDPHWLGAAWAWASLLSGLLGLAGILWQRFNVVRGLMIERGALLIQASLLVAYAGALLTFNGSAASIPVITALAWAGANVWEARNMKRDLALIIEASQ